VDRGHVVGWELQKTLWLRGLRSERILNASPAAAAAASKNPKRLGEAFRGAVITLPLLCLDSVAEAAREVAFGELGFSKVALVPAAELAVASWCFEEEQAKNRKNLPAASVARAAIAVDVGFSATTACAVFDGRALLQTVRRVDLGGKALTNVLKDAVSFRAVDLRQEGAIVEAMKEGTSFVSLDLEKDLEDAKKGMNGLEWVLPDGTSGSGGGELGTKGKARPLLSKEERKAAAKAAVLEARAAAEKAAAEASANNKRPSSASKASKPKEPPKPKEETVVPLTLERFMVPEALFHPLDVGLPQGGIQEAVAACAAATPAPLRALLLSNVLLFGGGAACPGIAERLRREVRPLVPAEMEVVVRVAGGKEEEEWKSNGSSGGGDDKSDAGENGKKSESNRNGPALAPWRGGSFLAGNLEWFESRAMTRAQWEEAKRQKQQEREQQQQQQQKFGRFGGGGARR